MSTPPEIKTNEGIVNLALHHLGNEPITSFDDQGKPGELARNSYAIHRDVLIRAFTWNCFVHRVSLSAAAESPLYQFANAYDMPSDWMRTLHVNGQAYDDWNVEGRTLVTNAPSPIMMKYLRLTDVSTWDVMFKSCLAAKLAMYWSEPIVKSSTLTQAMTTLFVEELKQAISTDSIEKVGTVIIADDWLIARATGSSVRLATGVPQPY